jgi:hypothetical protein
MKLMNFRSNLVVISVSSSLKDGSLHSRHVIVWLTRLNVCISLKRNRLTKWCIAMLTPRNFSIRTLSHYSLLLESMVSTSLLTIKGQ